MMLIDCDVAGVGELLERIIAEKSAGRAIKRLSVLVERKTDEHFDVSLVIDNTLAKVQGLDVARVGAATKWAHGRGVEVRCAFNRWPQWNAMTIDLRAREVLRVFDATATAVRVARGQPTSERGEDPTGQPSVTLAFDTRVGAPMEHTIDSAFTSAGDHASIEAELTRRGEALAKALGVALTVV